MRLIQRLNAWLVHKRLWFVFELNDYCGRRRKWQVMWRITDAVYFCTNKKRMFGYVRGFTHHFGVFAFWISVRGSWVREGLARYQTCKTTRYEMRDHLSHETLDHVDVTREKKGQYQFTSFATRQIAELAHRRTWMGAKSLIQARGNTRKMLWHGRETS